MMTVDWGMQMGIQAWFLSPADSLGTRAEKNVHNLIFVSICIKIYIYVFILNPEWFKNKLMSFVQCLSKLMVTTHPQTHPHTTTCVPQTAVALHACSPVPFQHHSPRDFPANPKCSSCGHLREDETPVKKRILWTIWVTPQELTWNLRIRAPWEKENHLPNHHFSGSIY